MPSGSEEAKHGGSYRRFWASFCFRFTKGAHVGRHFSSAAVFGSQGA